MSASYEHERRYSAALGVVASASGLAVEQLVRPSGRAARRARLTAFYLAHTAARVPLKRIAWMAGVDKRAVQHANRLFEEARERADIDDGFTQLEETLDAIMA